MEEILTMVVIALIIIYAICSDRNNWPINM